MGEADSERELKDKTLQETAALGVQIFTLRRDLEVSPTTPAGSCRKTGALNDLRWQESRAEACRLQKQKDELCSQIRDLSVNLTPDTVPELKKQVRHLEGVAGQRAEAVTKLTATVEQQQQVCFNLS